MDTLQSAQCLAYPNLLLVGFVKCGTTSLAKYLSDHPVIAQPVAKELYHLIDDGSALRSMQPIIGNLAFGERGASDGSQRYLDFFPNRDGCEYGLDATPFYYSQTTALDYAEQHPGVRVIFLVRKPEDRLASSFQYFQNVFQEYPKGPFSDFVEALLDDGPLRARYRATIKKPFFRTLFDDELDMGNYARHIQRWTDRIGAERVFVGRAESMRDSPVGFMKELCEFLGIEQTVYESYEFRSYMKSYSVRLPRLQTVARRLGREDPIRYDRMSEFQSPFHRVPIKWLRTTLDSIYEKLQHKAGAKPLALAVSKRLQAYYAVSNSHLHERYGIDYRSPSSPQARGSDAT
jgi:Sulfotransferase domain